MKVYLASKFENKMLINVLSIFIKDRISNTEIVSLWHSHDKPVLDLKERAKIDYSGVRECDILIAIAPFGTGTNSEMGYALGLGKKVIYLVDKMFYDGTIIPSIGDPYPLPVGMLDELFIADEESNGYIVHDLYNLIFILNILKDKFKREE